MKATPTGFKVYGKYQTFVEYEYRGRKYEVEYPNCSTYWCTSPKVQHEDAQAKIDEELDKPEKEYRKEDDAVHGFELFWEYVNAE